VDNGNDGAIGEDKVGQMTVTSGQTIARFGRRG
jgi:hypothetical protein